ncbi:unnamed protein product [Coffea canephora]|uniref:Uncharacterized protein n=1 Tax=Coffea canephora TaxID=49390 RepID=A0A068TQQ4_COFCA|nr:unnamed protein product [Coffea canephora]
MILVLGITILISDYLIPYISTTFLKTNDSASLGSCFYMHLIVLQRKHHGICNYRYQHQRNKQMSTPAMAQLLLNTLYYKRFFAYYTFMFWWCLMTTLGRGCAFGSTLIMPFLDNQLKSPSPCLLLAKLSICCYDLAKICFTSVTERDMYTIS